MHGNNTATLSTRLITKGLAFGFASLLVACGGSGGSSGSSSDDGSEQSETSLSGTLVVPEGSGSSTSSETSSVTLSTQRVTQQSDGCSDVPSGYIAWGAAEVVALDAAGQEIADLGQTDDCGKFSGSAPDDVAEVKATKSGFQPISTPADRFASDSKSKVASTVDENTAYAIDSLKLQSDGRLAITVVDDQTRRAVIGADPSDFSIEVNGSSVTTDELTTTDQSGEAASVSLVMDASGSMDNPVFSEDSDNDGEDESFTRLHLARLAAHEFLSASADRDEQALVIFDSVVDVIDDDWISNNLDLIDSSGTSASYAFSQNGFAGNTADLRLPVDMYSPYSSVYDSLVRFSYATEPAPEMHPETQNLDLSITSSYEWTGRTAAWNATAEGLNLVKGRSNDRKVVVVMSDGVDNESTKTLSGVIDQANNDGTTVFSVGLGLGPPESNAAAADLEKLGKDTGGAYFGVDDTAVQGAFDSIQTGIQFQYLASISQSLGTGDKVTLKFERNGITATRTITIQ